MVMIRYVYRHYNVLCIEQHLDVLLNAAKHFKRGSFIEFHGSLLTLATTNQKSRQHNLWPDGSLLISLYGWYDLHFLTCCINTLGTRSTYG